MERTLTSFSNCMTYLDMQPQTVESLFSMRIPQDSASLHAPFVKICGVYRPSIHGSLTGTTRERVNVAIDRNRRSMRASLSLPPSLVEQAGAPVYGYNDGCFTSFYGDRHSSLKGVGRVTATIHRDNTGIISYDKVRGGNALGHAGITENELAGFISACISALEVNKSRK